MAYLPKDYASHEVKIVFGLTLKQLLIIIFFMFLSFLIFKMSFLSLLMRIMLITPIILFTPIAVIYKTVDGDDLFTYLIKLLIFYTSPKYLVYKKEDKLINSKNNTLNNQQRKENKK